GNSVAIERDALAIDGHDDLERALRDFAGLLFLAVPARFVIVKRAPAMAPRLFVVQSRIWLEAAVAIIEEAESASRVKVISGNAIRARGCSLACACGDHGGQAHRDGSPPGRPAPVLAIAGAASTEPNR